MKLLVFRAAIKGSIINKNTRYTSFSSLQIFIQLSYPNTFIIRQTCCQNHKKPAATPIATPRNPLNEPAFNESAAPVNVVKGPAPVALVGEEPDGAADPDGLGEGPGGGGPDGAGPDGAGPDAEGGGPEGAADPEGLGGGPDAGPDSEGLGGGAVADPGAGAEELGLQRHCQYGTA